MFNLFETPVQIFETPMPKVETPMPNVETLFSYWWKRQRNHKIANQILTILNWFELLLWQRSFSRKLQTCSKKDGGHSSAGKRFLKLKMTQLVFKSSQKDQKLKEVLSFCCSWAFFLLKPQTKDKTWPKKFTIAKRHVSWFKLAFKLFKKVIKSYS